MIQKSKESQGRGILLTEITSTNVKNKTVYGKKNEPVTIISDRGNVFIVEGKNGRFAVNEKKLRII